MEEVSSQIDDATRRWQIEFGTNIIEPTSKSVGSWMDGGSRGGRENCTRLPFRELVIKWDVGWGGLVKIGKVLVEAYRC